MRSNEALLLDMLIAARKIQEFTTALTEEFFKQSDLHQCAIVRELQVIGEAARQISDEYKVNHTKIPWNEIAGMGNRTVHEYFRVNLKLVWETIQDSIPELITHPQPLIPPKTNGEDSAV